MLIFVLFGVVQFSESQLAQICFVLFPLSNALAAASDLSQVTFITLLLPISKAEPCVPLPSFFIVGFNPYLAAKIGALDAIKE